MNTTYTTVGLGRRGGVRQGAHWRHEKMGALSRLPVSWISPGCCFLSLYHSTSRGTAQPFAMLKQQSFFVGLGTALVSQGVGVIGW